MLSWRCRRVTRMLHATRKLLSWNFSFTEWPTTVDGHFTQAYCKPTSHSQLEKIENCHCVVKNGTLCVNQAFTVVFDWKQLLFVICGLWSSSLLMQRRGNILKKYIGYWIDSYAICRKTKWCCIYSMFFYWVASLLVTFKVISAILNLSKSDIQ